MRCHDTRARLVALQDDELSPSEQVQVREHLARCDRCRDLESRLARATPDAGLVVPAAVTRRLHDALDVDHILAVAAQAPAGRPGLSTQVRRLLQTNLELPVGVALAYAALMVLVLGAGAVSWWSTPAAPGSAQHIDPVGLFPVRLTPPAEFGPPPALGRSLGAPDPPADGSAAVAEPRESRPISGVRRPMFPPTARNSTDRAARPSLDSRIRLECVLGVVGAHLESFPPGIPPPHTSCCSTSSSDPRESCRSGRGSFRSRSTSSTEMSSRPPPPTTLTSWSACWGCGGSSTRASRTPSKSASSGGDGVRRSPRDGRGACPRRDPPRSVPTEPPRVRVERPVPDLPGQARHLRGEHPDRPRQRIPRRGDVRRVRSGHAGGPRDPGGQGIRRSRPRSSPHPAGGSA